MTTKTTDTTEERIAHEGRVLTNERAGSFCNPIETHSAVALAAYGLGTGDHDAAHAIVSEIAIRLRSIRAVLLSDVAHDDDVDAELYMLERRAEVARELLRRRGD